MCLMRALPPSGDRCYLVGYDLGRIENQENPELLDSLEVVTGSLDKSIVTEKAMIVVLTCPP